MPEKRRVRRWAIVASAISLARRRSPRGPKAAADGTLAEKSIPQYTTQPAPRPFGTGALDSLLTRSLKRRCDEFQVLSRGLALAGSSQDPLHEPTSILPVVGVEQCGLISLNAVQGASRRVLTRGVDCKGANTDNGNSHEHSRDKTFSESS